MAHNVWRAAAIVLAFPAIGSAECLIPTRDIVLSGPIAILGRVMTIQELDAQKRYVLAIIEVERVWKGDPPVIAAVLTNALAAESPRFVVGTEYILRTSELTVERARDLTLAPGTLWADVCSGTPSTSEDFSRVLRDLGSGRSVR